jgi:signal transduction histidine kinase
LIAIPAFYFVIQKIVAEDVDESLVAQKADIVSKLEKVADDDSFSFLEVFEPDLILITAESFRPHDSLFTISEFNAGSKEKIPYRVLESNVLIKKTPYTIRLRSSLLDSKDVIESIVAVMAALLLLIVGGLIIINRAISQKIWTPFYNTIGKLRHYRVDKNEPLHFDKTNTDEFADLNSTITSLAQRNQQLYQSQKEFTENASHEMQTPLGIFQNKLELLMQTNPLSAEQAGLMGELANASQRMNRLNRSLILLTKIENNQFPDTELVSIRDVISKLVEQYKFQADQKEIVIQASCQEDIRVEANKDLVEILLGNILSNAIRHNIRNGYIDISCDKRKVIIKNSAKGEGLDPNKLFQRFQKQSADSNSIGLGLEIVKKITSLYQFAVEYQFAGNSHLFSVSF